MLLKGKTAVIYGAGGAVGGAVARAFAREGASVFLTGRSRGPVEKVAGAIAEGGGGGVIFLISAVVFRSPLAGLLVVILLFMTVLMNFGLMGITGIPLSIENALTAAPCQLQLLVKT
jgi:NAD(P)-dependent dehydrogenase (short-subunit alcohol dehydrogenase family)